MRKLSLNKFRSSTEQQETRHTPEGGDSSRSQSQSSQDSPVHSYGPTAGIAASKRQEDDDVLEREKGTKGELKKSEKPLEKPTKTVAIVQHKSPSVIIESFERAVHRGEQMDRKFLIDEYLHHRFGAHLRRDIISLQIFTSSTVKKLLSKIDALKETRDSAIFTIFILTMSIFTIALLHTYTVVEI